MTYCRRVTNWVTKTFSDNWQRWRNPQLCSVARPRVFLVTSKWTSRHQAITSHVVWPLTSGKLIPFLTIELEGQHERLKSSHQERSTHHTPHISAWGNCILWFSLSSEHIRANKGVEGHVIYSCHTMYVDWAKGLIRVLTNSRTIKNALPLMFSHLLPKSVTIVTPELRHHSLYNNY